MSNIAVRVDGLSKLYRIGAIEKRHDTLRDHLAERFKSLFHPNGRSPLRALRSAPGENTIWALKDIALTINRGEIVGIIGRNGAGKSTLLKILSRITEPTSGFAEIHGRVSSLLEVGTGFHAELTGRENVYLNGAILGMRKAEIERKFDEMVAFAEVEKFIDTPVKHYSSGMYLRLAFAVAAHLEPEILIVDEVLAVGDASFQKKCLGKMQDVGKTGRTVLFVSHDVSAISRLCDRVILLENGTVLQDGPAHRVVGTYLQSGLGMTTAREYSDPEKAPGNDIVRLCAVRLRTEDGLVADAVNIQRPIGIEIEYEVLKPGHVLVPNFGFINEEDVCVFATIDRDPAWRRRPRPTGRFTSAAWIPGNFLSEGTLTVGAGIMTEEPFRVHFDKYPVIAFQVIDTLADDTARGDYAGKLPGVVRPLLKWSTELVQMNAEITRGTTRLTTGLTTGEPHDDLQTTAECLGQRR